MKTHQKHLSTLFAIAALLGGTSQAFAVTIAPSLGTASNFVVLGGAGVTCTASAVSGDVGSSRSLVFRHPLRPCVPLWERFTQLTPPPQRLSPTSP